MKKTVLLNVLILIIGHSYSQTNIYHPFPDSNSVWIGTDKSFDGIDCLIFNFYNLFISGDTTIGIQTYHKLYKNGYMWSSNCPYPPGYYYFGQYFGAFRQDSMNKKVYLNFSGTDTLAYNFNLNVGDTLPTTWLIWPNSNFVESIDSIIVDGKYRKMFWISSQSTTNYMMLIEGIGTDHGAFAEFGENWYEASSDLWCVYSENEIIWQYFPNGYGCELITSIEDRRKESKISIQPNPFKTEARITVPENYPYINLILYNSYGQEVKEVIFTKGPYVLYRDGLPNGLYIIHVKSRDQLISTEKVIITD